MKATLTFNLPKEEHEYRNAVDGAKMRSVLFELNEWFRHKLKYEDLTEGQYEAYEASRAELLNLLNDENIDLDS